MLFCHEVLVFHPGVIVVAGDVLPEIGDVLFLDAQLLLMVFDDEGHELFLLEFLLVFLSAEVGVALLVFLEA